MWPRLLLALLLPLASWLLPVACAARARFDVARVAVVAPLTGERTAEGQDVADAVRLALEEWNGAGGVYGLRLALVTYDQSVPETARRLPADPRTVLAIGYPDWRAAADARSAYAAAPAPAAVLLANPAASAPAPGGVVALAPTPAQVAELTVAAIAYNFGPVAVTVVSSGDADAAAAAAAFVGAAPARGLQVRATIMLASLESRYAQLAGAVQAAGASIVYVAGHGYDAGALWAELRPRDVRARIVLAPGALDDGFYRTAGGFFEGVMALELADRPADAPAATAFVRSFGGRFGRPPSTLAARAYDAATLGLRAIAGATTDGPPPRTAVRAALSAETGLNGVLGSYVVRDGAPVSWKLALYRLDHEGRARLAGRAEIR